MTTALSCPFLTFSPLRFSPLFLLPQFANIFYIPLCPIVSCPSQDIPKFQNGKYSVAQLIKLKFFRATTQTTKRIYLRKSESTLYLLQLCNSLRIFQKQLTHLQQLLLTNKSTYDFSLFCSGIMGISFYLLRQNFFKWGEQAF